MALDFFMVATRPGKRGSIEVYPKFIVKKSKDLMIRGGDFYAIWDEEAGLWSTDEHDALGIIDKALDEYGKQQEKIFSDVQVRILHMWDAENRMIDQWKHYCQKSMNDSYHMLDEKLIFSNTEVTKKDYASKRLSYPLEPCDTPAFDEMIETLYSPEERHKIMWCIGAIVSGASKKLQKFMVLYGSAGTGKSTVINIIQKLFDGYFSVFDAKALGNPSSTFALEPFKTNPLVGIQHDGDLSRIEDNTRLNSLVSHEQMTVNEKYKATYTNRFKAFLIMGTNKPVKITDAKSGILRRLIDVQPTGNKLEYKKYRQLNKQIDFEIGGIAKKCLDLYLEDPEYYDDYIPVGMLDASNDFYNFVEDHLVIFKKAEGVTLKQAWEIYKTWCEDTRVKFPMSQRNFKEELKNYFEEYYDRYEDEDGNKVRAYFCGFKIDKFVKKPKKRKLSPPKIEIGVELKNEGNTSQLDIFCADCPAQYANAKEAPQKKWSSVTTTLKDIDPTKLHYVDVPENLIVIDFDIPSEDGGKCLERNLEAAAMWPATYTELSKSGAGVHLHYIYDGDVSQLAPTFADHIEVKVFTGGSALRRKLGYRNNLPIATINTGLPIKEKENKMVSQDKIQSEKGLRNLIERNLRKECCPGTKPSMDFIKKILDECYENGMTYNVTDMQPAIMAFAANSTNQAEYCIGLISQMKFKSEEDSEGVNDDSKPLAFYDVEIFPNLFLVNWMVDDDKATVVRMINPNPTDIEGLMQYRLIGFNNRRYDNHMLYARLMGYSNEQLYHLSERIVGGDKNAFFGEAYNLSYTDIYDFAAKKQSLKKWEIELGIHHQELGLPWNEPVPEDKWDIVAEYCDNDVIATRALFHHLKGDFTARLILADVAGMTPNDTTNSLTTRIIFGKEKHPELVYTDLAKEFPGYEFVRGDDGKYHNIYRGSDLGFGGYVYAEPGMYGDVALLDVASLHPHSIIAMNCFGAYTDRFKALMDTRLHIKHKDYEAARKLFDGRLEPYLKDESTAKALSQALKIAINSVYGLTSASFDNPFRDSRNVNNIVALRGALFMRTLQDEVQKLGFKVAHIKTDSIKIPDATHEIIDFCMEFANKYGYEFEHEDTYDRICLVNNAVYIAKGVDGHWTATGAEFQHPYIFKKLFSHEELEFKDFCETKAVSKGDIYMDFDESLPDGEHNMQFVGRVGSFVPVKPGAGGGILYRVSEGKQFSIPGTLLKEKSKTIKTYRWIEAEIFDESMYDDIDMTYFDKLAHDAMSSIVAYGDYEWFVSDRPYVGPEFVPGEEMSYPVYPDDLPFDPD